MGWLTGCLPRGSMFLEKPCVPDWLPNGSVFLEKPRFPDRLTDNPVGQCFWRSRESLTDWLAFCLGGQCFWRSRESLTDWQCFWASRWSLANWMTDYPVGKCFWRSRWSLANWMTDYPVGKCFWRSREPLKFPEKFRAFQITGKSSTGFTRTLELTPSWTRRNHCVFHTHTFLKIRFDIILISTSCSPK